MTTQDEIKNHMALAFFASAYADQYDEADDPGFSMSGCDFMDVLPQVIDSAAIRAAEELHCGLMLMNSIPAEFKSGIGLEYLLEIALDVQDRTDTRGDRELTPEMFGHYLAMQAMGHGVGLRDAFGKHVDEAINVPRVEFSGCLLELNYF